MKAAVTKSWRNLSLETIPIPEIGPEECLISDVYPLEKLGQALEEVASGSKSGKILIGS